MQYATEPFLCQKCQKTLSAMVSEAFLFRSEHQRRINKPNLPNNIKNSNIHHQKNVSALQNLHLDLNLCLKSVLLTHEMLYLILKTKRKELVVRFGLVFKYFLDESGFNASLPFLKWFF